MDYEHLSGCHMLKRVYMAPNGNCYIIRNGYHVHFEDWKKWKPMTWKNSNENPFEARDNCIHW